MKKLNKLLICLLIGCSLVLAACGGGSSTGSGSGSGNLPSLGTVSTPQNYVLPSAVSTVPPQ
jgi:predicted small secreted protein